MKRFFPLVAILLAACASNQSPLPSTAPPTEHDLRALHDHYVVEFLRRNPSVNTYLGGAGLDPSLTAVDGTLRDYSQSALENEDQWLQATEKALEAYDENSLTTRSLIDRDVMLAQVRYQLHLHRVRHYQQRSLDTFIDEPFRSVDFQLQGMTQTGAATYGTAAEWNLVISRLRAIPQFMANARTQLAAGVTEGHTPDFRVLFRYGITTSEADASYFEKTLPGLAAERISGPERDRLLADLHTACAASAKAYRDLSSWIGTTFFEDSSRESGIKKAFAGDRYSFGEDEYNWALHNNLHVSKSAPELYDEALPIVEETQKEMAGLARDIAKSHSWKVPASDAEAVGAVLNHLGEDYPKSDKEMVQWYRDAAFRLVEYSRKTGLFDVPADYRLDVVETPPPLRASIDGAAYYPAPPFKTTGVGRYYVTPTDNDPGQLKENNRSALADLSAHEGFPGHDWYYKVLAQKRDEVSAVRWLTAGAVEDSSSMWEDSMSAEGWALYSEALMSEPQPGAPDGFYTPEEHLYQLQGKLLRDLRVRLDTGLHTGRLSYADAIDLYSQVMDFLPGSCSADLAGASEAKRASCTVAEKAIFRYSKWPTQAITYRLGKDEIYALRASAQEHLGARFDLRTFHLLFIQQGTIPAGYFGQELLGQLMKK